MNAAGSISVAEHDAWYVRHGGSVAAVLNVEENEETKAAARGMIDVIRDARDGEEQFVVIHQTTATVIALKMDDVRREVAGGEAP